MAKVAFITGGNGITGSSLLEYLVKNTDASQWSELIVTSRSPFKTTVSDPRITFIALDYTNDVQSLINKMKDTCSSVTHAYFSSYIHKDDFNELNAANEKLFANFLDSLLAVAPNLQNCTLQTGGKHYNVHLFPVPSPAREEDPRLDSPIGNFYYPQEDYLIERQRGQAWTWNVVRPEAIIGATSKPNGMNEALTIVLYMLVCAELGVDAPMPTNQRYWEGTDDVSDARIISQLTVWASTSANTGNQASMSPTAITFAGTAHFRNPYPKEGDLQLELSLNEWAKDKRQVWDRICDKAGVPQAKATWDSGTWAFQDWVFQRTWSATLSMSKARRFGFDGYIDSYQSFTDAIDLFVQRGQIPPVKGASKVNGTA
ncbi:uncharacterized protein AB675_10464 [Cyphellophora attinorum]|uniref:PRISE-like Rossmann-fold domain-containing protein n=1 Tax=Cyphellophora attinorum TaxID=1664694 RepID=A0A0N1NWF8_9EURO|nr:uncharacterized protein AB675_10464 [Phialophora attinorum]KPI35912.1 hypothetical protein AB675_10464 [Phialophora attinorum]